MKANSFTKKQVQSIRESLRPRVHQQINIWTGAIRSGKTIGSLFAWMLFCSNAPVGGELVIIGRTRDSAWRNIVAPLQDPSLFGDIANSVVGNYGASTVEILGRRVFIMGASDAKAEKVLRGLTVAGAYVDEVTTLPEEFFTQLLGRMSVFGARLFGTTNPDNPAHWLKLKFLDRVGEMPEWRHWHFTMEDNLRVLGQEYVDQQKRQFTGLWYRRFIMGEWVAAEGAVFSMWDPEQHVIAHEDIPPLERVLALGADHGAQAPSAGIALGISRGVLYAFDEWWLESRDGFVPTVAEQSSSLRAFHAGLPEKPRFVPVDPAALSFRTQLHRDGLHSVVTADNDVTYGVTRMAGLLSLGKMKVSDRCEHLLKEIPGYSWDPDQAEKGVDKPIKTADHAIDAWRYASITTESIWHRDLQADVPERAA